MPSFLTTSDLTTMLDCIRTIHAVTDAAALPMAMLQQIGRLVKSSSSALTQVDPVLGNRVDI